MRYRQAVKYLESFVDYEKIPAYSYNQFLQLNRVKTFLRLLGSPEQGLKIIHVAGSKGKGSVCAFIAYILKAAGFSVGLYTSPHLSDFRERIRVLSKDSTDKSVFAGLIPKAALVRLTQVICKAARKYSRLNKKDKLSFFEVYTALAFLYFKEKRVDFAVLETGLGGRLDATNAASSLVCAITPISFEHTQKLGKTLSAIAAEKAGIIKEKKSVVLIAYQQKEAEQVFIKQSLKLGCRLYRVGKEIKYSAEKSGFSVVGIAGKYDHLRVRLLGSHQLANAALAVGAVEALGFFGFKVKARQIRVGLSAALWPGRCEVIFRQPCVVLDGAQNASSAQALKKAIKENFKFKKLILVIGISSDKDIAGICRQLAPLADRVVVTAANTLRAVKPEHLAKYFSGFLKKDKIDITAGVKEAKNTALRLAGKNDLILVTGSLFVVGEFRDVKK
ncbi:MAG: bifunctional folylpolyglutamate synthase/dihydrofolate synthase [Candidatus Omnitrophica bacterium]|jgi:dihydrofolate synthase/folylpolyglutamate synthase|nr:bifunctional folylpolyglutamate synthase/dihydrofolate synthase [Candidatus Omnitrophota bacterium]